MIGHIHSIETFGTVDGPGIRYVVFVKGADGAASGSLQVGIGEPYAYRGTLVLIVQLDYFKIPLDLVLQVISDLAAQHSYRHRHRVAPADKHDAVSGLMLLSVDIGCITPGSEIICSASVVKIPPDEYPGYNSQHQDAKRYLHLSAPQGRAFLLTPQTLVKVAP